MSKKTILICLDGLGADYLDNEQLRIPNLKKIARNGIKVKRMTSVFPSLTWAIHTSVITGCFPRKHGVLGNSVLDRLNLTIRNYFESAAGLKEELVRTRTLYDGLHSYGYKIAAICWPLTQGAQNIQYNIPEFFDQHDFEEYSSKDFWNALKDQGIPVENYAKWSVNHAYAPMQDWMTKQILHSALSKGDADFILVHYLLIDSFQHDFGIATPEVFWAIEYIDTLLGETIRLLEKTGGMENTNIILFSDHGHKAITHYLNVNKVLVEHELYDAENIATSKYQAVSNGGCVFIYRLYNNISLDKTVIRIFKDIPGIKGVYTRDEFESLGLPAVFDEKRGYLPDIIVELFPGYCAVDEMDSKEVLKLSQYKTMHGYGIDEPAMDGFMTAAGPNFKNGLETDRARLLDIASTIANIYQIPFPGCDGRPLTELLK